MPRKRRVALLLLGLAWIATATAPACAHAQGIAPGAGDSAPPRSVGVGVEDGVLSVPPEAIQRYRATAPDSSIEEALDAPFSELGASGTRMGYFNAPIWLRARIRNESSEARVLGFSVGTPNMDDIHAYVVRRGERVEEIGRGGDMVPVEDATMEGPIPSFRVPFEAGEAADLYLRLRGSSNLRANIDVAPARVTSDRLSNAYILTGLLVGLLLALVGINVYYAMLLRKAAAVWLAAHNASWLVYLAVQSGIARMWIWPDFPINNAAALTAGAAVPLTFAAFIREQMETRETAPRIDLGLRVMIAAASAVILLQPLVEFSRLARVVVWLVILAPLFALPVVLERRADREGGGRLFATGLLLQIFLSAGWGISIRTISYESTAAAFFMSLAPMAIAPIVGGLYSFSVFERMGFLEQQRAELELAQERMARLMHSSGDVMVDVAAWIREVVPTLRESLRVDGVAVWEREEGGTLCSLFGDEPPAQAPEPTDDPDLEFRLAAPDGANMGIIRFEPSSDRTGGWNTEQRSLARGFVRHVEIALALRRTQRWLDAAEAARARSRDLAAAEGIVLAGRCTMCQRVYPDDMESCPRDGASIEGLWDLPLVVAGRYRLERRLGVGGMGAVFEAEDTTFSRAVAVKIANPALQLGESIRERFQREGRVLAALAHENVVQVIDAGRTRTGHLFMVMELLRGPDLDAMIKLHGRGSPKQVAQLLRDAAGALGAVHDAGLVHRDVKPANFVLLPARDGLRTKLVDFGVVHDRAAHQDLTQTGQVIGTPRYLAPETVLSGYVSAASDLFSLALVVFAALVGEHLIQVDSPVEALRAVTSLDLERYARRLPSPKLVPLFAAALALDPVARPRDIVAWAAELAELIDTLPGCEGWPREWTGMDIPRPSGFDETAETQDMTA